MNEFQEQVVAEAKKIARKLSSPGGVKLANPVVVAGLADIVKNATAAIARAKAVGENLTSSVGDLMSHVAAVESMHSQVVAANEELSAAIASVDAPLDHTQHSGTNSEAASVTGPQASPKEVPGTDGAVQSPQPPAAPPPHPPLSFDDPAHGIRQSVAEVQMTNSN